MERYRIHEDVALYYLTFTVVHWLPVFINEEACLIVAESLNFCHEHKGLRINAYVIMPTHVHLVAFDSQFDSARFQQTLADMRKFTGRKLVHYCKQHMPRVYGQVLRPSRRTDRQNQFWQPSRHPVAIWKQSFWESKFQYLHDNPRRKGLVRDATHWRFSSAAYWLADPSGSTDVALSAVNWI